MNGRTIAVVSLLALGACGHKNEQTSAVVLPTVRTAVVKAVAERPLALRGSIQAGSRLRLGFKQPGIIAAVLVKEGEQVREGQVLAQLDQTDAKSQVRVASANKSRALRGWSQANRLAKAGALANNVREDARSALEAADAALVIALDALNRTKLQSPVNGKVVQRLAQAGETIGPGMPVFIIDEVEKMAVKVGVTDRDLPRVQVGQTASLKPEDGSPAFTGSVSSVAPSPDATDGLYGVEIEVKDQKLQPGGLIAVEFEEPKRDAVLRIPLDALVRREDKDAVFVVQGAADAWTAHLRGLELGRTEGREIAVRAGLKDGERIITEGAYFLQDGQSVRVMPAAPPPAASSR